MTKPPDESYSFRLFVFHETEKAWLAGETLDRDKAMWLPKSQCLISETGLHKSKVPIYDFSIPEWLLISKGLL